MSNIINCQLWAKRTTHKKQKILIGSHRRRAGVAALQHTKHLWFRNSSADEIELHSRMVPHTHMPELTLDPLSN